MKRLRVVPLICALCLLVALGAMAWISWTAMQLERTEAEAWERAETEERVRLALWRMDSSVTPLLTEEIARPETEYEAFYSTGQAYGKQLQNIPKGEILVPSPLLSFRAAHIHLHFQIYPGGKITSPQVPLGNMRDVAEARGHTTTETVNAACALRRAVMPGTRGYLLLQGGAKVAEHYRADSGAASTSELGSVTKLRRLPEGSLPREAADAGGEAWALGREPLAR